MFLKVIKYILRTSFLFVDSMQSHAWYITGFRQQDSDGSIFRNGARSLASKPNPWSQAAKPTISDAQCWTWFRPWICSNIASNLTFFVVERYKHCALRSGSKFIKSSFEIDPWNRGQVLGSVSVSTKDKKVSGKHVLASPSFLVIFRLLFLVFYVP